MAEMSTWEWILFALVIVGGLNWGLVGLFEFNLVSWLLGRWDYLERGIYVIIGIASGWSLWAVMKS